MSTRKVTWKELVAFTCDQWETTIEVHDHVVMDTPEDRELHDKVVAKMRDQLAEVRRVAGL